MKNRRFNQVLFFILLFINLNASAFSLKDVSTDDVPSRINYLQNQLKLSELIEYVDSLNTQDGALLLIKAKAQYMLGDVNSMETTLQQIYTNNPADMNLLAESATLAEMSGNKEKAIWFLNQATKTEFLPSLLLRKCELCYALKRYEQSLMIADSVLSNVTISQAVRLKARNLAAMKRIPESVSTLADYLKTNPADVLTVKQLANLYLAVDSVQHVVNLTDKYLTDFQSTNTEVLDLNARGNYLLKNYRNALNRYREMQNLGVDFDHNQCFFAGMSVYMLEEDYPLDAISYFLQADSLTNGGVYAIKYYLGKTNEKIGQWEKAYSYYKDAYELIKPDTVQLVQMFNNLGLAAMSNSEDDNAVDYYLRVLSLDDKNNYALYSIALVYEYKEDWMQAIKYYKKLIEKNPDVINNPYSKRAKDRLSELEKMNNAPGKSKTVK